MVSASLKKFTRLLPPRFYLDLCNRLTVTYIFIGIIPILLLLLMAEGTVNFTPAGLTSG
jgi:hypothetical protein